MSEKKSKSLFVIGYVVLLTSLFMMSSCGMSQQYHIGTGYPLKKNCGPSFSSHPQY